MSNQRFFALGLVFVTGCVAFVLTRIFDAILLGIGVSNSEIFGGLTLSVLLGVGLAAAAAVFAWMNPKVQQVGQEVAGELKKVTWPTWPEIRAATFAVVIATAIAAVLLGLMDFVSAKVMTDWIPAGIHWAQGLFA